MADAPRMNTLAYGGNCFKLRMQRDSNDQPSTSRSKDSLFIEEVTRKSDRNLSQKLAKKRYISNIRNDPELNELEKEKERQRYLRRKNNKEITSINKKSPQQQKSQREKWREASKKYREKKKQSQKIVPLPEIVTVKEDDIEIKKQNNPLQNVRPTLLTIKKIRYQEFKKRTRLTKIIKDLKKKNIKLKSIIQKLSKYKNQTLIKINKKEQKHRAAITKDKLIKVIRNYYEDENNSVISPGKKEYITRHGIKKQKRYLNKTLKKLQAQFIAECCKVSYSHFCAYRPFWVLIPTTAQRDTCICITHSNINLLISALNKAKIINEVDVNSLLSNLCCSISNIACLRRECQNCKVNIINYNEFLNDQNITYFKWIRCQERFMTKTGTKLTNITKKDEITANPLDIIKILNDDLPSFLKHCYIQQNQYQATKDLKTNLNINCALLNIDFSENFTLKYTQEVQSMHFGGSRKEVCLHTAVFYTFDYHTSSVEPTSVCSCSECLRHDAPTVWAHIVPLLKIALEKNPFIDTLHFKSDSPTAQYRNKYIFYIITQICKDFSQILYITRNYTEAGHGKGPADAVAGTVKRTAENLVNHGEDINTFAKFINTLSENLERIVITSVTEEDIKAKEQFLPKNLKTFKGTLNVHQVLWDKNIQYLTYRSASCFLCVAGQVCEHGKHIGFTDISAAHLPPVNNECNVTLLGSTKRQNVLSNITNMPSTSQNDNAISLATDQVLVTKGGNISTIKILSNIKVVFKNK